MPFTLRHRYVGLDRQYHRHLVVLPVFLLLMAVSAGPAFFSGRPLTASVTDDGPVEDLGGGLQARVEDGGVIERGIVPVLERGRALFRSEGIAQVRLPAGSVLALAGAFHVVIDGPNATVSAVTAPVFVTLRRQRSCSASASGGEGCPERSEADSKGTLRGRLVLVPQGMQYQIPSNLPDADASIGEWVAARKTMLLPEYFLKEQLQALHAFPPPAEWLPVASALPSGRSVAPRVQLPAAQAREREQWRVQVLGALRAALDQSGEEATQKILGTRAYDSALADPRSFPVLVALAARPDVPSGVRASLLAFLLPRRDLWLLAAVHPVLRGGAWTQGEAPLTSQEQMILAFGLPATDRHPEGASPVQLAWWAQNVERLISAQEKPVVLVAALLTHHIPMVREYVRLGYPERAQILARSLADFAKPMRAQLPSALLSALSQADRLAAASYSPVDDSAQSSSDSSASAIAPTSSTPALRPIAPEERVSRVEAVLERAGALFSVQTKIEALGDGVSVHVSTILFASPAGDRSYAFDVHVPGNQVSSIVRDGKLMPYPMDLTAFLEWVKK